MDPTRRTLLKGLGGIAVGGVAIANLQTEVRSAIGNRLVPSSGRAAAVSVSEDNSLDGFSDVVTISAVDDPAANGDSEDSDEGDADDADGDDDDGDEDAREGVIHITSIPSERTQRGDGDDDTRTDNGSGEGQGDGTSEANGEEENESDDAVTLDYGISVVNVRDRGLTVSDIYDYEGDDSSDDDSDDSDNEDDGENGTATDTGAATDSDAGFAYDWYTTDRDIVRVDTDREQIGGGPDEAWLLLQPGGNGNEEDNGTNDEDGNDEDDDNGEGNGDENGDSGDDSPDPSIVNGLTLLFRTMYADSETGEWHTRTVSDEFQNIEGQPWKRLSVSDQEFVEVGYDLLEEYGDATIHAVGVGRGDPFWGPSKLDTYYHDLQLNGETYTLPTTYDNEQAEGSDDSAETVTPDGSEA